MLSYSYTGQLKSVDLPNGTYRFSLWGAQGGFINSNLNGRGAYSEGLFDTKNNITIYLYVGKMGQCAAHTIENNQPFSGGNNAVVSSATSCTGGEATFISLSQRTSDVLIVSGAGGGSGIHAGNECSGGFGGPSASDGNGCSIQEKKNVTGKGARINYPGEGGHYAEWRTNVSLYPSCDAESGKPFKGGNACSSATQAAGGGGSGYYGGGGGADVAGGGGGSSYASKRMTNVILLNGDRVFLSPQRSVETGHAGDGYITISLADKDTINENKCIMNTANECYESKTSLFEIFMAPLFIENS